MNEIWEAINSPAAIAAAIGMFARWAAGRFRPPLWIAIEGAIIAAVKFAEKAIPDDTPNRSMARLDAAMKYVLTLHGDFAGGRKRAALREGIQIVHARLERDGCLRSKE